MAVPIYNWFLVLGWFVFMAFWFFSALKAKKNVGRSRYFTGGRLPIGIIIIALLLARAFGGYKIPVSSTPVSPLLGSIGVVVCYLGIAFAIWARVHLGRNWGMPMSVQQDAELVTTGPYEYVRNPIYTGVLTAMLGTAFIIGLWWLIPFGLGALYFIYSAKKEETLMMQQFPNQYPEYKKRTKMLIPFVF